MGKINTLVFAGGAIHDWKGCSDAIVNVLHNVMNLRLPELRKTLTRLFRRI